MSERQLLAGTSEHPLDLKSEEEWQRLRKQLALASGFWLGFLFADSRRVAGTFRKRVEAILSSQALQLKVYSPQSPDDLINALPWIFELDLLNSGGVWIEAVHADPPGASGRAPGPWRQAWEGFLLRANERRERLRRRLDVGLMLAAPSFLKPSAREAAPDLWSIRSLVLEPRRETIGLDSGSSTGRSVDADFAESLRPDEEKDTGWEPRSLGMEVREGGPDPEAGRQAARLLRLSAGLLSSERYGEAIDAAAEAVELLERNPESDGPDLSAALVVLSNGESLDGDNAAAEAHLSRALELRRTSGDREVLLWLDRLAELAEKRGDTLRILEIREEIGGLAAALIEEDGESPQALRDLSVSLNKIGDAQREAGDLDAANEAFQKSLQIAQRLLDTYGESPQALRDLSVSLLKIGQVLDEAVQPEASLDRFKESAGVMRNFRKKVGSNPGADRDLAAVLKRLQDQLAKLGQRKEAKRVANEIAKLEPSRTEAPRG